MIRNPSIMKLSASLSMHLLLVAEARRVFQPAAEPATMGVEFAREEFA
jgi:hypothetical protein